ncbi:hypothetical protein INS49_007628 [Diaporthe citri]|uniref:uncharacterized protein n=1 Tax=Diaporthe citri TaxID=83186 RepID=UPI001C81A34C|nr:uncharacterized protein INS49_007628 [Diaporthe citri]KAG6362536.1 hypothetical protein INS49_007628 [Diaporthe citri]
MAPESRPRTASEREDKQQLANCLATGLLAGGEKETMNQVNKNNTIRKTCIMDLPREIMDEVFNKLSQEDHKSLRVVCGKFEQILNPLVFRRAHISKARVDRVAFCNVASTSRLAVHVKELVWFELAEDENVFIETANDAMPAYHGNRGRQLVDAVQHDNSHTLPDLSNLASSLFWLPSTPKEDDPQKDAIDLQRSRILGEWFPVFYRALESLPKLDTFTSRPMPAYHILSNSTCEYKFVAYLFQMDIRSDIQDYQRNDGLFTVLLPALTRLRQTIKHLHWADEAYGDSSSIKRIRYRHGLSFKYLKTIDLCLGLPTDTRIRRPWARGFERTCWAMLGACLDRVRGLEEISLCFEKANPRVGIDALMDALDQCLFSEDIQLLDLTRLNLRDGPARRVPLLDFLLSRFLIRYGPVLRHLSFRRWSVSQNLLHRLSASGKMKLEGFKIDNSDFESGATIPESSLLAFLNNRAPRWPLPLGQVSCKSTIGSDNAFMETPGIRDWANPKFAYIPEGMDFCAAVIQGSNPPSNDEDDGDEDDDFEPSESSDDEDSDSDSDLGSDLDFDPAEVDPNGNSDPQSESGDDYEVFEDAGSV